MLNVGRIEEGFVLDHIKAGKAMTIYHDLGLDKLDCTVAIIKNAKSEKMGKKDILKVECPVDKMDLDILGFIDHNITVNVIKDGEITAIEKTEENIMEFTTMERLQMKVSASYGAVIQFGDKVFVTDCHWKGGFTAEIYEFVETPDETGLGDIECRLAPWGKTDERFADNGHAIA